MGKYYSKRTAIEFAWAVSPSALANFSISVCISSNALLEYEIILDSEDLAYGGFSYRTNKKYNITDGHVFIDLLPCSALILKKINC